VKRAAQKKSPQAFALELHTAEPEQLARFYEETLGIKFRATKYPFERYYAKVGNFGLIIGDSKGRDAETASEPGKFTLDLLSSDEISPDKLRYYLHHRRPLGSAVPGRLAHRLRDPEGNYIAFAPPMENVLGTWPSVFSSFEDSSFGEILHAVRELFLVCPEWVGQWLRLRLANWRDRVEAITDRISVVSRDLSGYTHVVGTRQGLYVANAASCKRVVRGSFFGITVKDGDIYCFQTLGESGRESDQNGRVVKLTIKNNRIEGAEVVVKGLDSGCHQIDFIGDDLFVVDCYNGRILEIRSGLKEAPKNHYPLGEMSRDAAWFQCHMNSVVGCPDGTIWVLLHNGGGNCSEILVLDREFRIIRRFYVDAAAAHNIVFTNDASEYLIADSHGGRIISARGVAVDGGLSMSMVRGISLNNDTCVIGDSAYATRYLRRYAPGHLYFFDRNSWTLQSTVVMPGAPTDIRRIDGKDLSISNYVAAQCRPPLREIVGEDEQAVLS
jgi:hypothetical protein